MMLIWCKIYLIFVDAIDPIENWSRTVILFFFSAEESEELINFSTLNIFITLDLLYWSGSFLPNRTHMIIFQLNQSRHKKLIVTNHRWFNWQFIISKRLQSFDQIRILLCDICLQMIWCFNTMDWVKHDMITFDTLVRLFIGIKSSENNWTIVKFNQWQSIQCMKEIFFFHSFIHKWSKYIIIMKQAERCL